MEAGVLNEERLQYEQRRQNEQDQVRPFFFFFLGTAAGPEELLGLQDRPLTMAYISLKCTQHQRKKLFDACIAFEHIYV
jgi:hypothetical protein